MDMAQIGNVDPPAPKKTLLMGPKKLHPEISKKGDEQLNSIP